MRTSEPLVSIVLRTKNEEERIERCLRSCLHQTYRKLELVVIDNKSTDATKEIARKFTDLVFDKGPERIAQGNFGMIEIAQGEYVMYIDADMILEPGVISAAVLRMEEKGLVGLYINEVVLGNGYWGKLRRFERNFYNGTCIDAARFLRRSHVVNLGGFDEDTFPTPSAEDWDLDRRMAEFGEMEQLIYEPCGSSSWDKKVRQHVESCLPGEVGVYHGLYHDEATVTPMVYLKKKKYYSGTMRSYIDKWGQHDPIVRKQFGVSYRMFQVFLENGKWRRLAAHPLLTLGMIGFRAIVGLNYLVSQGMSTWKSK